MLGFRDLHVAEFTVATDTNIYADHDQLGAVNTLSGVFHGGTIKKGVIESIALVDKSKQKSALTLHFFSGSPTLVSSDNAALDISDADLASYFVGKVEIAAGDYQDLANAAVACLSNINLPVKSSGENLFCVVESAGTPTYAGTTDLVAKVGIVRG